ncbi:beta-lactamase family protein [Acinetobacter portensis]|uniref:Serine hydrolase n=3 Tax=Acinetobacter TaxID=469 RepID=A0A6L6GIE4_9GAMM|nr:MULTISPECIES: serine hydrolase domain-containing protein [Acinetobacter]MCK7609627.1 beta-lactamase family protein [Acinetobacter portensis]MCK7640389.1 beta-lactamase family protein [Acinetobacter portensis]MDY6487893.1 serine hydrolase domain-containing protein [Acinetobacter faecalis]MDY6511272.1 serine hydrolase domain-containing protein [Acinetobacter faecalis]MTD12199.1 serine hydrolase [Acinetobacter faecalis]
MNRIPQYLFANQKNYKGYVDPRFKDLAKQFSQMQDARTGYGGAALVVFFQGEKVIDIFTGKKSISENWQSDTLSVCYSTGKGVLATLAHILVSEGFLNYDTPVAQYWPEFAQNGKEKITLRHMLCHQSGLFDIRSNIQDAVEMTDWSYMLQVIEQATPRFSVGADAAYQPFTFGWQVGGLLEKATNKSLKELMEQYLIKPLNLDGAFYGVPEYEMNRVARPLPTNKKELKPFNPNAKKVKRKKTHMDRLMEFSGHNPLDFQDAMIPKGMSKLSMFNESALKAIIPAANGVFTAQSLAKIYAMLANKGTWNNQQFIKPEIFQQLSTIQYIKRDRVMPIAMHWRLGFHRLLTLGKKAPHGFGHIGFNGSGAWCDPQRQLSFAYTHNFQTGSITGDYRLWGLTQETLRCADADLYGYKGWF